MVHFLINADYYYFTIKTNEASSVSITVSDSAHRGRKMNGNGDASYTINELTASECRSCSHILLLV